MGGEMKKSNIPYVISALKKKGEKWEELKEWLESYNNPSYTLGKPTVYQAVQKKMKELEEK
jgi:hypothetical protein